MKNNFARWNMLFAEYLKRDWKLILVWVAGMGIFAGGFVPFFEEISKGQGLLGMYETMKNPAMIALVGVTPVKEAADYTVGAMYSHMMLLFSSLIAMMIPVIHVVSHTRKEEENGITEMICSYRVGRYASSFALMAEELLIHVLLSVFIGGLMAVFQAKSIETAPAFLFGMSVGMAGLIGASVSLVTAQVMTSSAGATGTALGIVGLLYLLRAGTDISDSGLSGLNPMGWIYRTFPFTENHWQPLGFCVIFCVVLVLFAFVLEGARDKGAGYLPERTGSGKVRKSLLSVPGLFLRLNRGIIAGWLIVFFVLGATYGSIYGDMETFLESNELIQAMFTLDGVSIEASFTSVIMVVMEGLTAILPIVIINRLFAEEGAARLNQLFSTKVTRMRVYWVNMALAAVSGVAANVVSSAGLGTAALATMKECSIEMADFLASGMNYFSAVLFQIGLAALVLGWAPRLGKMLYVYAGYTIMINYFQGILDFPEWLEKTAVLSWIPRMPVEEFDPAVFAVITGIGLVMILMGAAGYRRRDLIENE